MTERLPQPVAANVKGTALEDDDILELPAGTELTRIHPLGGDHPVVWNAFRGWGPTQSRFDHQPPPRGVHKTRRIAYATFGPTAFPAALAEYFQDDGGGVRPIDTTRDRPAVTRLEIVRPLVLLNLDRGWVTRAKGNQAIRTGHRSMSREWARAIYRHHPTLDGLAYSSSVWGPGTCVALWERAEDAFPATPAAHRTLDDPVLAVPIANAARSLRTIIV
ncbi:MAG TPA: RES family NAD+ phosphorylase [Acidimicrobiales bacterium]